MGRMGILGDDYFQSDTIKSDDHLQINDSIPETSDFISTEQENVGVIDRSSNEVIEVKEAVIHFLD